MFDSERVTALAIDILFFWVISDEHTYIDDELYKHFDGLVVVCNRFSTTACLDT